MVEIPLSHNRVAIVDDEDYEWLSQWKWRYNGSPSKPHLPGYAVRGVSIARGEPQRTLLMHREILGISNLGAHIRADHINGDSLDNRRSNLRVASVRQNRHNSRPYAASSAFKGVWWDKRLKKWVANITVNGVQHRLGTFLDERKAAQAYNNAALFHFGQYARINDDVA